MEQRSGGGTHRASPDHALCWRELKGRLSTWLRTFPSIRASIPHVHMASSSSSRKGIDARDDHRAEVGWRHSPCATRSCSLLARIEREALNMVENLPFNTHQHSPCKYGGVAVVPSRDSSFRIFWSVTHDLVAAHVGT